MTRLPTLKQLRYLVTLSETEHFGRAAAHCHVTQSTFSAAIKTLEETLGEALVLRTPGAVRLTDTGQTVVARAHSILRATEDLVAAVGAHGTACVRALEFGTIPTIGPYLLPTLLERASEPSIAINLSIHEQKSKYIVSRIENGEIDVGLLALPFDTGDLATEDLALDEMLVCVSDTSPLADKPCLSEGDLADQNLIVLEDGHCLRDHVLQACQSLPATGTPVHEAASLRTILHLVRAGAGATLIPAMAVASETSDLDGVKVIPFCGDAPSRRIALCWRTDSLRLDLIERFRKALESLAASCPRQARAG